jgi:hypothetical protein
MLTRDEIDCMMLFPTEWMESRKKKSGWSENGMSGPNSIRFKQKSESCLTEHLLEEKLCRRVSDKDEGQRQ